MTRRDKVEMAAWWALIAALMAMVTLAGCTAKRVTTPDGTVIESYGFLAGHQLQAGEYERTMLGAKVKIDGYGQHHDAAKAAFEAIKAVAEKMP